MYQKRIYIGVVFLIVALIFVAPLQALAVVPQEYYQDDYAALYEHDSAFRTLADRLAADMRAIQTMPVPNFKPILDVLDTIAQTISPIMVTALLTAAAPSWVANVTKLSQDFASFLEYLSARGTFTFVFGSSANVYNLNPEAEYNLWLSTQEATH